MIPGDFQPQKPTGTQLAKLGVLGVVLLGIFIGIVLVLTFVISSWLGRPVVFGHDGPDQPIEFPHETHVKELGMDCTFCHRNVEKEAAASVPGAGL